MDSDTTSEVALLKGNAENLAKCLHALLGRIEELERKNGTMAIVTPTGKEDEKQEQVDVEESVNIDPVTGIKRRTVVTERVLTTKTYRAIPLEEISIIRTISPDSQGHLLSPQYESRIVEIDARQFNQMEVESLGGQLIVTKINPEANHNIHPGDTIISINGKNTNQKTDIEGLKGRVQLTLVLAPIHQAPSIFYRVNSDYNSDCDENRACRWLDIHVKKGEIVQVMSTDNSWIQARKVNDLSRVGHLPATLPMEKVSMLCPYGRRVLVFLGAVGVGRRTLKSMLLRSSPHHFATVVPLTSRAQRPAEQEGREYSFVRKEDLLKKIREGDMIEWGELDNQIYGTSAESVRSVVRSGRMCVLDCAPQALSYLYNGEFMPFVVHIVPPQIDEFLQLESLRQRRRPVDQLSMVCAESDKIATGAHANQIHLTLINRNLDVTFKRLKDALESLRTDIQWVPESWMC